MITEVYIENSRADIKADLPSLLNFAIDDIVDFGERSTTWSKTIILPGTKNNNKLLGNIFQIGQANEYNSLLPNSGYNFNASKSASCLIFQGNVQAFMGDLRLLQINIDNETIEYEVAVFGTLFSFNVALSGAFLSDLDFSEYDHTYNKTEIVASWDNTPGSGVYYPLIDYGTYSTNKHDWDIRTFRPSLYVKEYLDKIFEAAGFSYESDLFATDRFNRLVVPHNQKNITKVGGRLVSARVETPYNVLENPEGDSGVPTDAFVAFDFFSGTNFTLDINNQLIEYTGASPVTLDLSAVFSGEILYVSGSAEAFIYLNGAIIATQSLPAPTAIATPEPYSFTLAVEGVLLNPGDVLGINFLAALLNTETSAYIGIDSSAFEFNTQAGTSVVNVNPGDDIELNYCIPKNVRQIDFLVSIVKLFNLYVYGDKFNERLIYFKPYVDFYSEDSTDAVDWTYKLDRKKRRTIKPMSELNSKIYLFKYKSDSDFYNDLYNKRYGEGYGSYTFDTEYEFAAETNSLELIFAATPLVGYDAEDKVYSTIFKRTGTDADPVEENVDSVIRILQTKKITGLTSWNILNGATVLDSVTAYGYAGHLDDPNDPDNDLNFGALNEVFFTLLAGNLSNTQFNIYWSSYMAEITDKDSKLLAAEFYLYPQDIFDLDFSKYINVDGVLFRLNKISDYNTSQPDTCKVELLKVINTIY